MNTASHNYQVGNTCTLVRRLRGSVDHTWTAQIVKITKSRVYLDGGKFFSLKDENRVVYPKYLEYTTSVDQVSQ